MKTESQGKTPGLKVGTAPDFDLAGMVEASLEAKDYDSAIKQCLEGILVMNKNMENIATTVNQAIATLNGGLRAMQSIADQHNKIEARLQALEHLSKGRKLS